MTDKPIPTSDDFRYDLGRELDGDRAVAMEEPYLKGKTVGLMVTGGIAAFRSPDLIRCLRKAGADVYCYATPEALRFATRDSLEWCSTHPLVVDLDGRAQHVEDAREIDAWLVAPATYSTINKAAWGIADNALTTTLAVALGQAERDDSALLIAPTMHGNMVNGILRSSLARLATQGATIIPPRAGAGKANIPEAGALVRWVARALTPSILNGRRVLLTLGNHEGQAEELPGALPYGDVLGKAILEGIWIQGAEVEILCSASCSVPHPERFTIHRTEGLTGLCEMVQARTLSHSADAVILAHRGGMLQCLSALSDGSTVVAAMTSSTSEEAAQTLRNSGAGYAASCHTLPRQRALEPFGDPAALLGTGGEEFATPWALAHACCMALSTALLLP